jgi:hypothetical protein
MCDWLAFSQKIPIANGERYLDLRNLRDAISECRPRPDLTLIICKAFGMVAVNRPVFRRVYVPRPRPYFYEHSENVASVVIGRRIEGEYGLLFLPITRPEERTLQELELRVAHARHAPLDSIPAFRRQLRAGRMPRIIRRAFLQGCYNWSGHIRARYLGTFGMSVLTSMGGATLTTWTPWTLMLHYTPFDDSGTLAIRFGFDHRVFDGFEIGMAIQELHRNLNGPLLDEVRALPRKNRAA